MAVSVEQRIAQVEGEAMAKILPDTLPKEARAQKAVHLMLNEGDFDILKVFSLKLQPVEKTDGSVTQVIALLVANALPAIKMAVSGCASKPVVFSTENLPLAETSPEAPKKRTRKVKTPDPKEPSVTAGEGAVLGGFVATLEEQGIQTVDVTGTCLCGEPDSCAMPESSHPTEATNDEWDAPVWD